MYAHPSFQPSSSSSVSLHFSLMTSSSCFFTVFSISMRYTNASTLAIVSSTNMMITRTKYCKKKHRQYYQHCLVTQNSIRLCTQRHAYYSLQQSSRLFYYEIMKKWLQATSSTMTLVFFHKNPGYRVACWPNEVCILSTTTKNNTIFNTHRTNRKASLHPAILSVCTTMKL